MKTRVLLFGAIPIVECGVNVYKGVIGGCPELWPNVSKPDITFETIVEFKLKDL